MGGKLLHRLPENYLKRKWVFICRTKKSHAPAVLLLEAMILDWIQLQWTISGEQATFKHTLIKYIFKYFQPGFAALACIALTLKLRGSRRFIASPAWAPCYIVEV